jgi:hypothetical protein
LLTKEEDGMYAGIPFVNLIFHAYTTNDSSNITFCLHFFGLSLVIQTTHFFSVKSVPFDASKQFISFVVAFNVDADSTELFFCIVCWSVCETPANCLLACDSYCTIYYPTF